MKYVKKIAIGLVLFLLLLIVGMYLSGYGYIFKAVYIIYGSGHKTAFLSDYECFDNNIIHKSSQPQPWALHKNYNQTAPTKELEKLHQKYQSVAFLIFKNDSIWHERYFDRYTENSKSNSFSMAKTYVSALLGKAIFDGYIKGLNQPVSDFLSGFSQGKAARLTVGDLASMASGSDWDESYYNPFSVTTQAYFDTDLRTVMQQVTITDEPGKQYIYQSGNTQLLAMVIEKATGKTLSNYLSESLWKPLGAESDALWQVDSQTNAMEKAYCCIASNARDFARLGKLYRNYGKWNGSQILDSVFVAQSITPRFVESPEYGYGMWLLTHHDKKFFMMRGHLGQYVIVQPDDNIMIVRLGHLKGTENPDGVYQPFTDDIYQYIDETYKMLENAS
ncbi:serine hydrolase [Capnocytophaga sp.]|uniref:serine hydrolase domain-containing protein n=1 Tax=Capnocytophaga sp. TaxID=44737 RepID=UPI0026DB79DB|nr:serine hydrolase [Capnocytophaga sp.]MDO5106458.1 serine hydrolase [Capnocytophaga sp.]